MVKVSELFITLQIWINNIKEFFRMQIIFKQ